MNVYFVDSLPETGQGVYIDYFNRDCSHQGWRRIDLERILSLRQEDFFLSIEKWHTDLCVRGARRFKWWWLSPASRLILWHPPIWKPLVFALAGAEKLEHLADNDVYFVGCPGEVAEYLGEFCSRLRIHDGRNTRRTFPHTLRHFWLSFKYIFAVLMYILSHRKRKLDIKGTSPIIVWTYGLHSGTEQLNSKDHFFGDMFDPDVFKHPVHWVYYDSLRNAAEKQLSLCPSGTRSVMYEWIGISDWWSLVRFCLSEWCFHCIPLSVPKFVMNGYVSKAFTKEFTSAFVGCHVPGSEFVVFLVMKKILRKLSPRAVVYPYEEKCMERALLMAVRESKTAITTIGFAHAVYNSSHMYLRRRSQAGANPPMPDKLMVTGKALKNWLVNWAGWETGRIFIAGSPRWRNTMEYDASWVFGCRPLRILILIGPGYEATALSDQMERFSGNLGKFEVTIRPYPYSWQAEQSRAYAKIKKGCRHIQVSGGPLEEQLSWCDLAVYCSTSAGLEAMLSGRLTVYLDLNHIFELRSVSDKKQYEVLWSCKDLPELGRLLERVCRMSKLEYADIVNRQNRIASQIFQKIDYGVLNNILDINMESGNGCSGRQFAQTL